MLLHRKAAAILVQGLGGVGKTPCAWIPALVLAAVPEDTNDMAV
jgi:hypothetical protein